MTEVETPKKNSHKSLNKYTLITKAIRDYLKEAGYSTRQRSIYENYIPTYVSISVGGLRHRTQVIIHTPREYGDNYKLLPPSQWLSIESGRTAWNYRICQLDDHLIADPNFDLAPICDQILKFLDISKEIDTKLNEAHRIFKPKHILDRYAYDPDISTVRKRYV